MRFDELDEAEKQAIEQIRGAKKDGAGEMIVLVRDGEIVHFERIVKTRVRSKNKIDKI